jgi:hypothetical protein
MANFISFATTFLGFEVEWEVSFVGNRLNKEVQHEMARSHIGGSQCLPREGMRKWNPHHGFGGFG